MNRKQLDALLRAGIITGEQHAAALATVNGFGLVTQKPQLSMQAPARQATLALDESTGTLTVTGIITAYGQYIPSHGMTLQAGALHVREPLSNTKMLRDHDQAQPVGYMSEIDAAAEVASFTVAASEAPRVQQEFDDKLRDGLSIGLLILDYTIDDDWNLTVTDGEIYEVSLCACPAVNGARVTDVAAALATQPKENYTVNPEQLAAALTAGTITQEQHDAALAAFNALHPTGTPAPIAEPAPAPVPLAVAAGPELPATQAGGHAQVNENLSLPQVARRFADAYNNLSAGGSRDPRDAVRMAIADVLPADDAGNAFVNREDWVGQVWQAADDSRPWIDSIGEPGQMTTMKGKGWVFGRHEDPEDPESAIVDGTPDVDEYAGNKTEVPSNEIGTLERLFDSFRIAGGWDIDRVYFDFPDPEFWQAFLVEATKNYKRKSNASIRTRVLAFATDTPTPDVGGFAASGISAVLKQLRRDVRATLGGHANRIFLGNTIYDALEELDTEHLPLWLKNAAIGLGPDEGSADVGTLHIVNDPALGALDAVVFDNRALAVKERSPFWIQAENIPNGGIDAGVFSYLRLEEYDKRVVIKRTYAA